MGDFYFVRSPREAAQVSLAGLDSAAAAAVSGMDLSDPDAISKMATKSNPAAESSLSAAALSLRQEWIRAISAARGSDTASRPGLSGEVLSRGDAMVQANPAMADDLFFRHQAAAAFWAPPDEALRFALRLVERFPANASAWYAKATAERRSKKYQEALASITRALDLDPKVQHGNRLLAIIHGSLGRWDSTIAIARRSVNAGEDREAWSALLLEYAGSLHTWASSSRGLADYELVLSFAKASDELAPTPKARQWIGMAAYEIGMLMSGTRDGPLSCTKAKAAQSYMTLAVTRLAESQLADTAYVNRVIRDSRYADYRARDSCK